MMMRRLEREEERIAMEYTQENAAKTIKLGKHMIIWTVGKLLVHMKWQ